MVHIAIQGVVGGKVLARETIKAYRKDVTQWLYGGKHFFSYPYTSVVMTN